MTLQRHQEVVNLFMKQIYTSFLKPGYKLPTEKQLIEDLGVDRSSLRVGLKQLESMGVLDIRQGDGMYVKDYLKNAGIDFLRILFQVTEPDGKEFSIDEYLIDEIWEFWILLFPQVVELAMKKHSNRDLRALMALLDEEVQNIKDRENVIKLEVRSHDLIVEIIDNTIILLLFNSCRPLREKIVRIQISEMDDDELLDHIESKRALVKMFASSSSDEIAEVIDAFRRRMQEYREKRRRYA